MLIKFFSKNYLLILVCVLFLATRLYKISDIPTSAYWDEASIGYNAYSVLQTGKDEWDNFLPLHFRAFGEFKLPVYIYATIPFIKLLGLNETSVRMPSVFFSLGIVIIVFFLARRLSDNISAGLWSSLFLTISPWFFIFSRTGYEATAGLFFYLLGIYIYLFLQNKWCIVFSTVFFILSIYSYNSFRIISPITIFLLFIYKNINLSQIIKVNLLPICISIILILVSVLPIYKLYKYDAGISRLQVVGGSLQTFIPNYLSHFNTDFLFFNGDKNLRSQQSGFGQLNFVVIFFLPLGFIYASKIKYGLLTILLLIITPIPAALTKESPHSLRSIAMIPFLSIFSAWGVVYVKRYLKGKYLVESIVLIVSLVFFTNYFLNFVTSYSLKSSKDWQLGYKRIFKDYQNKFSLYDNIVISNQYAQPYIFGLYYLKYNPDRFLQEAIRNSVDQWGFSTVKSFNNFTFDKITIDNIPKGKSLIFATQTDKLSTLAYKEIILNLDNSVAFYVYEYKK